MVTYALLKSKSEARGRTKVILGGPAVALALVYVSRTPADS